MPVHEYLSSEGLAKFPFLFVVTYGRSGSTLLQGILNSIPQYAISGENNNALYYMFKAHAQLQSGKKQWGRQPTDPSDSWYGIDNVIDKEFGRRCANVFLDTCLRPPDGTRCIGFKEIRYARDFIPDEDFVPYLNFLCEFFPGAGFVFNIRRPEDVAKSGWWKKHKPQDVVRLLSNAQARFNQYAEGRDNAMIFDYDELVADWRYAESLFKFLDEKFDLDRVKAVMEVRHSF
jgi:hypothetical protein